MYDIWFSYYGECITLCAWGILLVLVRRVLFGRLYKDAVLGCSGKGAMVRQMTLKFEKSYELKVGIPDRKTFVKKYMCHEKRFGIRLIRWRSLPERWSGLILCAGFVEAVLLSFLEYRASVCINRFLAAAAAAALVRTAILWFEADSLWELSEICLLDYVSNSLYPRQMHSYEGFEPEAAQPVTAVSAESVQEADDEAARQSEMTEKKARAETEKKIRAETEEKAVAAQPPADKEKKEAKNLEDRLLKREEEQIFQEVITKLFGQPT